MTHVVHWMAPQPDLTDKTEEKPLPSGDPIPVVQPEGTKIVYELPTYIAYEAGKNEEHAYM